MSWNSTPSAFLVLANGRVFEGKSFGASGETLGEVVFTTGMTGYLETLTDPSYNGQIVTQTFPLIGNYGVIPEDFESAAVQPKGYIAREWCEYPSNFRSQGNIDAFLKERGIVGLCGVDTRELTRVIRDNGVMGGVITANPENVDMKKLTAFRITDAVANVSIKEVRRETPPEPKYRVALWDFGVKENIVRNLFSRGCEVIQIPYGYTAEQIRAFEPDGVMLSNGPGDPAENTGIIAELRKVADAKVPIFGICLGHQLLALSMGGATSKLKYGHRGANQPARDVKTGRVSITTQNHGYMVDSESLGAKGTQIGELRYINANDGTCEGIDYLSIPAFTVQFHPEAAAGPRDTSFLFDRFLTLMDERSLYKK
ncbi:carbamoyl-phosphate synthase small chain [Synergistales bacterium]|nr:carbamoyl-phosphate synthase small chain [Synergistales bacterium]